MRHLQHTDIGKKVAVYYNINAHLWSVRYRGIVIGHTNALRLDNVTLKISEAGRQRVLREGRKNVHAFAVGTLSAIEDAGVAIGGTPITYNPYKYNSFVTALNHVPVYGADVAWLVGRGVAIAGHIQFQA